MTSTINKEMPFIIDAFILFVIFLLNPFFSVIYCLLRISKSVNGNQLHLLFFFAALFFGLLAYTQTTSVGDISRVYSDLSNETRMSWDVYLEYLSLGGNHPVFSLVNRGIAKITGNVQYISLFWTTLIYFLLFCGIKNILTYKHVVSSRILFYCILIAILCFVIFAQATELMKQAVAVSIFFYSYSCYLLNKRLIPILLILITLGIHFSILFYIPVFFIKKIKCWVLLSIFAVSFLFRVFDLMAILAAITGGVSELEIISETAEYYSGNLEGFMSSSALTFQGLFWLLAGSTIFVALNREYEDKLLAKVCLVFLIILNLSYTNNHNFTRLLTLSYPFYTMILIELLIHKGGNNKIVIITFIAFSLLANIKYTQSRTQKNSYFSSYMDNSIIRVVVSPSFIYIDEKQMSKLYPVY